MGENYFPLKMFGLTVSRIVVEEPFSVSQKMRFRNFCAEERGGGASRYCRKKFSFQRAETKILVVVHSSYRGNFWCGKFLCISRGYHDFLSEYFYLKGSKNFLDQPFCVSKKFQYRTFWCIGDGSIMVLSIFFVSPDRKTS